MKCNVWNLLEPSGTFWNLLEPSGTFWNLLEAWNLQNFNLMTHGRTYISTSRAAPSQLKKSIFCTLTLTEMHCCRQH